MIADGESRNLLLYADSPVFHVDVQGNTSPSTIVLTALPNGIPGQVKFSTVPAVTLGGTGNNRTLAASTMADKDSLIVNATIDYGGRTYSRSLVIQKIRDGMVAYTWIKYATSATGADLSDSPDGMTYIGFAYNKSTSTESNNPADYTWSLIKGTDGVQGPKGTDGVTTYTWIKYSDNADGAGLYDVPTASTMYIGIAVNKTVSVESTSPADYVWSKFKGDQGVPGSAGPRGLTGPEGAPGMRGTIDIALGGYNGWDDNTATQAVINAGYGYPQNRDRVTMYNTSTRFSATCFWDSSQKWLPLTAYINGNMLVSGTLSASVISGGTMSADLISGGTLNGVRIGIGSGSTFNGYAFEVGPGGVVSVDNIFGGIGSFLNSAKLSGPAVQGLSNTSSAGVSGHGTYDGCGVDGVNTSSWSAGKIATAGYDFYAYGAGAAGPFTGAHDALVPNDALPELGDLMIDSTFVTARDWANGLFTMTRSSEPYQRGVRGPVSCIIGPLRNHAPAALVEGWHQIPQDGNRMSRMEIMAGPYYEMADTHTLLAVNGVGEGLIKVCGEGGPIGPDDLLVTSSTPGVAMRQNVRIDGLATREADDVVRGYTVAKARVDKGQAITFASDDTVIVIPCIYLGG